MLLSFGSLLLVNCSGSDPNLPTAEMRQAHQAIDQAEKAGARRYALPDLKDAEAA
jgi:hypothetical protein